MAGETNQPTQAIQIALEAGGVYRQPVIDNEHLVPKPERDWQLMTEVARRAIATDPATRAALVEFIAEPVSETMPGDAVDAVSATSDRAARIMQGDGKLARLLKLPAVPDELIVPDIRNAPELKRSAGIAQRLAASKGDRQAEVPEQIRKYRERAIRQPGISEAERKLIETRYRYARDIKLLALSAELHDHPFAGNEEVGGLLQQTLPSGTEMTIDAKVFQEQPHLLDPSAWQQRRKIKDRVHEVTISNQAYILKERKTNRHMDNGAGYRPGKSSKAEFKIAREFTDKGKSGDAEVVVRWEKPLGFVEFPDGYQFCIFEAEPGLIVDKGSAKTRLVKKILQTPEQYQLEYDQVTARAAEISASRDDLLYSHPQPAVPVSTRRSIREVVLGRKKEAEPEEQFSFEDFAVLKAAHLLQKAGTLVADSRLKNGYLTMDGDDYGFRFDTENAVVEAIGFDFEYYESNPEEATAWKKLMDGKRKKGELTTSFREDYAELRRIDVAASLAILERMGWPLPPPKPNAVDLTKH